MAENIFIQITPEERRYHFSTVTEWQKALAVFPVARLEYGRSIANNPIPNYDDRYVKHFGVAPGQSTPESPDDATIAAWFLEEFKRPYSELSEVKADIENQNFKFRYGVDRTTNLDLFDKALKAKAWLKTTHAPLTKKLTYLSDVGKMS